MITTVVCSALTLAAGLGIGWALGFESCAHQIDGWTDADWQEVRDDD